MLYRAALTAIVALIVGVCVVGAVQTPAYAFQCPPGMDPETCAMYKAVGFSEAEAKNMSNIAAQMLDQGSPYPDVGLRYVDREQARTAFGRAWEKARTKYPRLAGKSGKAALVGTAATFAVAMTYLGIDGYSQYPTTDLTFTRGNGASYSRYFGSSSETSPRTEVAIQSASWSVSGGNLIVRIAFSSKALVSLPEYGSVSGYLGFRSVAPTLGSPVRLSPVVEAMGSYERDNTPSPVELTIPYSADYTYEIGARDRCGSSSMCNEWRPYTTIPAGVQQGEVTGPRYNLTDASTSADPQGEADLNLTPEETRYLYDQLREQPEYTPHPDEDTWAKEHPSQQPNPETQHGPAEWTRENPDGSTTTRYQDGTEITAYPDGHTYTQPASGPGTWTNPDGSARPSTDPAPHTPPDHTGAPTGRFVCKQPPRAEFDLPETAIDSPFPFSMIVAFFELLGSLVAPPRTPVLNLPEAYGSDITFSMADPYMETWRLIMRIVMGLGFLVAFYRIVAQSRSD